MRLILIRQSIYDAKRVWYAEISIPVFFILWGEIKKYETEQESEKYRREPDHRGEWSGGSF